MRLALVFYIFIYEFIKKKTKQTYLVEIMLGSESRVVVEWLRRTPLLYPRPPYS